jgi:ribose transport system substrate-binding protein
MRGIAGAVALLMVGAIAVGCGGTGSTTSSTQPAGSTTAASSGGLQGVVGSLPAQVQPAYADLNQPVEESPWKGFKPNHGPPWKIGYSSEYAGNTWRAAAMDRAMKVLLPKYKEKGLVSGITVTESNLNDATQIQQIRQLVEQGADAIITCCPSVEALNGAVSYAHAKGVPVFVFSGYASSPYAINVSANYTLAGRIEGKWLADEIGGKGTILNVVGIPGASASDSFDKGLKEALGKYPGIKVVGNLRGQWTDQVAKSEILKYLATHPEKIDGVATQSAQETGTVQALLQSGRPMVPVTTGGEAGAACYWRKHRDWISKSFNLWPPGDDFEGTFDAMIRTLQGQSPKVQSIARQITTVNYDQVAAQLPADCDVNATSWIQPGIAAWWPDALLDAFFEHPRNPLAG